jgi:uncharacterized protein
MRETGAYGLPKELLEPAKMITDPVHGDIYLIELERRLVDTQPFQRLRRVRQLGNSHLVYPSATHTRFSHSLGALRAAQDLLDIVLDQRSGRRPVKDLFTQWSGDPPTFDRRIAEATLLTRLGALMHDFCHIPYGHTIEDELGVLEPHDQNLGRFEALWGQIDAPLRAILESGTSLEGKTLFADLKPIILSKLKENGRGITAPKEDVPPLPDISYPFAADIIGNTISADLIDYLQRDHIFTGLPAALGHRFLEGFYVVPDDRDEYPQRMAIRVRREDGSERRDAISELLKYLRFRYELSERALVHHAKLAADAMVGKTLEMYRDALWVEKAMEAHPKIRTDASDISRFKVRYRKSYGLKAVTEIDEAAKAEIEMMFLNHGDDGLLEHLLSIANAKAEADRRWAGIKSLVEGLRDRKLFKRLALTSTNDEAQEIFQKWGNSPEKRRNLERAVARAAEVKPAWKVVAWIPPPGMRLKAALVLVDDNGRIRSFVRRESSNPRHRGKEIYDAHEDLWSASVFAEAEVAKDENLSNRITARTAELLRIERWDDPALPVSLHDVAFEAVCREDDLKHSQREALRETAPVYYGGAALADDEKAYSDIVNDIKIARDALAAEESDDGAVQPSADADGRDHPRLL